MTHDQLELLKRLRSALYVRVEDGFAYAVYWSKRTERYNLRAVDIITILELIALGELEKYGDRFYLKENSGK